LTLQCHAARLTGWRQTGWKIGCTSEMAQKMLNTTSPFPGPVYAERTIEDGGVGQLLPTRPCGWWSRKSRSPWHATCRRA
jgi:hypothetical protein